MLGSLDHLDLQLRKSNKSIGGHIFKVALQMESWNLFYRTVVLVCMLSSLKRWLLTWIVLDREDGLELLESIQATLITSTLARTFTSSKFHLSGLAFISLQLAPLLLPAMKCLSMTANAAVEDQIWCLHLKAAGSLCT